ncbi:hypothetical protein bcgnr5378_62370 [Bacillus cereus]|uniref:Uncharacterized protein n=1 Tax=Bacillus cereus (strain Q1) TaxID=361100 RepID=B9J686_BACCQ|nr:MULTISPECIES: hypothetical protein [Bacillus]ACM15881.1 hypothetical protein BCQ_PI147 [Bacillus cereus Q1]MCQ6524952.1 hypothetical protein [Bacillus paranthracis]MCU5473105.1 hypothetical protein [Bacillus paranthracis]MCU5562076.1 hypothetical protein [Bacillus pacificus]MDA1532137.1 hypothetical protein [Bacillus cereus group sp. TH260-2LC]
MMKKLVLATLGLVITLSIGLNTGDTQHALKKEEIIQYSHADHF